MKEDKTLSRKSFLKSLAIGTLGLFLLPRLFLKNKITAADSLPLKANKEPRSIPNQVSPRASNFI